MEQHLQEDIMEEVAHTSSYSYLFSATKILIIYVPPNIKLVFLKEQNCCQGQVPAIICSSWNLK